MSGQDLQRRARRAGIETGWTGVDGRLHEVGEDTLLALLALLEPAIEERAGGGSPGPHAAAAGIAGTAHLPPMAVPRALVLGVQLYAIVDERDQSLGDLETLARAAVWWAGQGGDALLVNPLGPALDPHAPGLEPYAPSSRLAIDPLYFALDADQTSARDLRSHAAQVPALRLARLQAALQSYRRFCAWADPGQSEAFQCWRRQQGGALESFARFQLLSELADAKGWGRGWSDWPGDWQQAGSAEVERLARIHAERVDFHVWLQWRLESQWADAHARALASGQRLGLGRDLPIGCARHGAETWAEPSAFALAASIGAPPDPFAPEGQDWGLPPLLPTVAARHWRALLQASMRQAGLLRIDHVMGLERLFWIPQGASPAEGAYVRYPREELLAIVIEQSRAAACVVVGEDLGTVDPLLRERLAVAGILSSRVLRFERDGSGFRIPADYPLQACSSLGSHDLPTLAGWIEEPDFDTGDAPALRRALSQAGIALPEAARWADWRDALHGLLASTPSLLVLLQAEDLLGGVARINRPGSVDPDRNWAHRLPLPVERWPDCQLPQTQAASITRFPKRNCS